MAVHSGGRGPGHISRSIGNAISGAATLSAPTLGYPSSQTLQPTIVMSVPVDWQSGNKAKLALSSTSAMTAPTILSHTIIDADVTGNSFSFPLPVLSVRTYFQGYGNDGTNDSSHLSNIVSWGDTTAPTITTSASQSVIETLPLSIALTATDTGGVASWSIAGGPDQLQFQITGSTLQWVSNGSQSYTNPLDQTLANTYQVTVQATDYSGNSSTLAITVTVTQADLTPTSFTFTNVSNAAHSTLFTSNTITIAGLQSGFNVASSLSGTGFTYSKNGGGYQSPGSFTVTNGDTLTLQDTSGSADGVTNTATVTVGTYSTGWTVSTPGLNLFLNSTFSDSSTWTLGSGCSISGGALHATAAGQMCQQPITFVNGGTYQIDLDYTCTSGANIRINLDVSNGANVVATSGALNTDGASHHLTITFTANVTTDYCSIEAAGATFTGTLDNATLVRTA